jgi:hypothetical protein
MKRLILVTMAAAFILSAQSPQMIPIQITVNWPNGDIVRAKYGKLPKTIYPGEVTGCNTSDQRIVFTQGAVVQALKSKSLEAYSRTDAIAVINAAQRGQFRSKWLRWSPAVQSSLRTINGFVLTKVVSVTPVVGTLLTTATAITDGILPIVNSSVSQDPNLTYEADGMAAVMQLPGGSCLIGTVMFAMPGSKSAGSQNIPAFTIEVQTNQVQAK